MMRGKSPLFKHIECKGNNEKRFLFKGDLERKMNLFKKKIVSYLFQII